MFTIERFDIELNKTVTTVNDCPVFILSELVEMEERQFESDDDREYDFIKLTLETDDGYWEIENLEESINNVQEFMLE